VQNSTLALALAPVALLTLSSTSLAQEPQPLLGSPVLGLNAAELDRFEQGLAAFTRPITVAEGLGPGFNATSCAECHSVPTPGGAGGPGITLFARTSPYSNLNNLGGPALEANSISPGCQETIPAAADLVINRATPSVYGLGFLNAIPDSDVIARSNAQPPGISGTYRMVRPTETPGGPFRIGRMARKGLSPTLMSFSIGGARNELGLTSPFLQSELSPNGDPGLAAACDPAMDPEDNITLGNGMLLTERYFDFQKLLAAPPQTPRSGHPGEALFDAIGCADCHYSGYVTGPEPEAALTNKPVRLYSDLLIHDVGSLGDGRQEALGNPLGPVTQTEMMTRPLWGMVHRPELLHDGSASGGTPSTRARTAILAHDGEALASKNAFAALSAFRQGQVIAFLNTLGRAEFDADVDNDRDLADWALLAPLLNGPAPSTPHGPESAGAVADVDQDGDFDLQEVFQLQEVFGDGPGPAAPVVSLDTTLRAGGSSSIVVPGGSVISLEVVAELSGGANQGLAGVSFDLEFAGGQLEALAAPPGMASFAAPNGITNPAGFGGTATGATTLLQVGGAQNTINNAQGAPMGSVQLGVAASGSPAVVALVRAFAPAAPGTYTVDLSELRATAVRTGANGAPYWRVQRVEAGVSTPLTVVVQDLGASYCDSNPNSTGLVGRLGAVGSTSVAANDLQLHASGLPPQQFSLYVMAPNQGFVPNFAGSQGNLCLGSSIVRFNDSLSPIDLGGVASYSPDLTNPPQGGTILPGQQWYFQLWHRDVNPGVTSNTTNGYAVSFQ